jgi:hypothetical protein
MRTVLGVGLLLGCLGYLQERLAAKQSARPARLRVLTPKRQPTRLPPPSAPGTSCFMPIPLTGLAPGGPCYPQFFVPLGPIEREALPERPSK